MNPFATGSNDMSKSNVIRLNGPGEFSEVQFQTVTLALAAGPPTPGILDGTIPLAAIAPVLGGVGGAVVQNQVAIDARDQEIPGSTSATNCIVTL